MSKESLAPTSDLTDDERFGAYICDDETVTVIAQVLEEKNLSATLIKSGGIENAIRTLASMKSPQILVVDLSKSIDPNEDINALAEVCDAGTMVIALGTQNDVNLYRELISAGIQDYLVKPLNIDDFRETLLNTEHALRAVEEEAPEETTFDETDKIISVIGVRGGVGASTIATSVAWLLGNRFKRSTALLDMDVYFGTGALTFDLEPGRGLSEALENPSRVDGLFIERAMVKESLNLSILGAEASLNDPTYTDPSALTHLLNELKSNFRYVVMDLPRNVMTEHPLLLSQSNEIIIVSDLSLPATRDTIRMIAFCKNIVPQAKITILINKYPGPALAEVSLKDYALSIEREVDWEIALDQKLMLAVARDGKNLPASAKNSRMVKIINAMTRKIIGYEDEKIASKPFWKKFAGKKKTPSEQSAAKKRA
jgi:pilus assembly protein CpaE